MKLSSDEAPDVEDNIGRNQVNYSSEEMTKLSTKSKDCLVEKGVKRLNGTLPAMEAHGPTCVATDQSNVVTMVTGGGVTMVTGGGVRREAIELSDSDDNIDVSPRPEDSVVSRVGSGSGGRDEDVADVTDKILNLSLDSNKLETLHGGDRVLSDEQMKRLNTENPCMVDKLAILSLDEVKHSQTGGAVSGGDVGTVGDTLPKKSTKESDCVHIYPKEIKDEVKVQPVEVRGEVLEERGPTHGRATAFIPSNQTCGISRINMPMAVSNYGNMGQTGYNFQHPNIMAMPSVGKRGADEDMIPPYKYNRPPDEINDLDNPQHNRFLKSVNRNTLCGGQVVIKSPNVDQQQHTDASLFGQFSDGDANEILQMLEDSQDKSSFFSDVLETIIQPAPTTVPLDNSINSNTAVQRPFTTTGVTQANITMGMTKQQSNIVTGLTNMQPNITTGLTSDRMTSNRMTSDRMTAPDTMTRTYECRDGVDSGVDSSSDGYTSEASPFSDTAVLSPPPSNMSNDSGVSMGSVLSPTAAMMDVASPRSQLSGYDGMSASPHSQLSGYDGMSASPHSQLSGYDGMSASPHSQLSGYDGMSASPRSQNGYDSTSASPGSQSSCYDNMMTSPQNVDGMPDSVRSNITLASPRSHVGGYDRVGDVTHSPRVECNGNDIRLQTNLDMTSRKIQPGYDVNSDMTRKNIVGPGVACMKSLTPASYNGYQKGYRPSPGVQSADQLTAAIGDMGKGSVSKFIDDHFDDFQDVLNIVCRDLIETKVANMVSEKPKHIPTSDTPASNVPVSPPHSKVTESAPVTMATGQPAPATAGTAGVCMTSSMVLIPNSSIKMATSASVSTMIPVTIAQPIHSTGTGSQGNVSKVMTSQIVLIPANQQPQTYVVVNPTPANSNRRVPQYVPIKPKLPTTSPLSASPAATPGSTPPNTVTAVHKTTKGGHSPKHHKKPGLMKIASANQHPQKHVGNTDVKRIVGKNQLNIARRLVAAMSRDNIHYQDKDGDTYLHVAVCRTDKYLVQALLERQIRENLQYMVDMQNNLRQTPLYLAVSANQPEMVAMLIDYRADVNIPAECILDNGQREVKAAIHCAASQGHEYLSTLETLMKHPELNLNHANSDGQTALHCAIRNHGKPKEDGVGIINSIPIIEFLIKSGADPSAQDKKSGKTPLMYAIESKDVDLIERTVQAILTKDPVRFSSYLKAHSFDGKSCLKILDSLRAEFDPASWERLSALLPINGRGGVSIASH